MTSFISFHNLNGKFIFAQPCGEDQPSIVDACRKQGFDVTAVSMTDHLAKGIFSFGPLVGVFVTSRVNARTNLTPMQASQVYTDVFEFGQVLEAPDAFDAEEL